MAPVTVSRSAKPVGTPTRAEPSLRSTSVVSASWLCDKDDVRFLRAVRALPPPSC